MQDTIDFIVGLGNPGQKYQLTRHNAGFWFSDSLSLSLGQAFKQEAKFQALLLKFTLPEHPDHECWLMKPTTFVNRSGQSVAALARFYKIPAHKILVVHDELDLPAGAMRLKQGGGHGGHNGLRDIITQLGSNNFLRLRIGIGHPGEASEVVNYVLSSPAVGDQQAIAEALSEAFAALPLILKGNVQKAMHQLHSRA